MAKTIGPESWKTTSMNNIKLAQAVVQRSDKFNDLGRQLDPLPSLKDSSIQQSNAQIHSYVRATRSVVFRLHDYLLDTEEEIKSLIRAKENLEKVLEHIRKDIILNEQSQAGRKLKPTREREKDGADGLLSSEKKYLLKLKKILEGQLREVQKQLQVLDNARKKLKEVLSERTRVLDLICHSITPKKATNLSEKKHVSESRAVNALGAYTPEAAQAITMANEAVNKSAYLIGQVYSTIYNTRKIQKQAYQSVNRGLTNKINESMEMKKHLQLASGETRMALHRGKRWLCNTEIARGYTLGPVSSADLTTRERLDRPSIRVFQRHPGTQLPEAQQIIEGHSRLDASLDAVCRNVGMLNLTQQSLKDDIRDKKIGAEVDSSIVRYRRRMANHRWVVGGLTC